jgi:hypothetical protein
MALGVNGFSWARSQATAAMKRYPDRHRFDIDRPVGVLAKRLAQRRHVNGETAFFDE